LQKYSHMKNEKLPFEQRIPYSLGPSNHPARSRSTAIPDVVFCFQVPETANLAGRTRDVHHLSVL
jgi:hypothetical protein